MTFDRNAVVFDDDIRETFVNRKWFIDPEHLERYEQEVIDEDKQLERKCCGVNRGIDGQRWFVYHQSLREAICPVCLSGVSPALAAKIGILIAHTEVNHVCPFCGTWLRLVQGLTDHCPRWIILFPNAEFRLAVADLYYTPDGVALSGLTDDRKDDSQEEPDRACGPGGDGAPPVIHQEQTRCLNCNLVFERRHPFGGEQRTTCPGCGDDLSWGAETRS